MTASGRHSERVIEAECHFFFLHPRNALTDVWPLLCSGPAVSLTASGGVFCRRQCEAH
jgi:hypothetical protein